MAHVIEDRVQETSTTTGTGAFTLAGAVTGFRAFSAVCSTSDTVPYIIEEVDANGVPDGDWETGIGTYSAANTLTRTTVLESSNAGAAVNWAAGDKRVAIGPLAHFSKLALISSATPSAVSSVSFTSIPQYYTDLFVTFSGISHDSGTNQSIRIELSPDGSTWTGVSTVTSTLAASATIYGGGNIRGYVLGIGHFSFSGASLTNNSVGSNLNVNVPYRVDGGVTAIRFSPSAGNFDAGTITLYGL